MTPDLPPAWRPRRREDVVFRRVGEEWLLFDPATQLIHVLNLTAALVWSFCEGEHTVEAMAAEVGAAFAGGAEEAGGGPRSGDGAADRPDGDEAVAAALRRFAEEGLLEEETGP